MTTDIEITLKESLAEYASVSSEPKDLVPAGVSGTSGAPASHISKFKIPLVCKRSGLLIGEFFPSTGLAKNTPYVTAWKENSFLHPVFSMDLRTLMIRANACWQLEKAGIRQYPMRDKQLLFLAMMHASGCIKQDVAGLPSPRIVETHFARLIELLGWKYETASERVTFPKLHVWKGALREDTNDVFKSVPAWLDASESCRDEYENKARERQKAAKVKAHDAAMKSIRKQMYSDVSLKRLWNWFAAQVPQITLENNPDCELLFFTEEQRINVWTEPDIEALETLFLRHCETGNSVSYEFAKRIRQIAEWLRIYNDTFTIVDTEERFAEHKGTPAPERKDFPNNSGFLIAKARWQLANKASSGNTIANVKPVKGDEL